MSDLPVLSRNNLRRGQASLYDLIVTKLESGEAITMREAEEIWKTKVCRNMIDGVPNSYRYYYSIEDNVYRGRYVPMMSFEIEFNVMNWLTKNIGLLVMRGYLKVIPMIKLESLDTTEIKEDL